MAPPNSLIMSTQPSPTPSSSPFGERIQNQAEFTARLQAVQKRIADACERAGRSAAEVRLLPVSKTHPSELIAQAYEGGCHLFGENKVQEAHEKWQDLKHLPQIQWALIGHLQTNKAKRAAEFVSEFQALDSLRLAAALDRHLQAFGRSLDVFVQVNTSQEESKFGLAPEELLPFLRELPAFSSLRVRGLMTLALFSSETERVRPCFQLLRRLHEEARQVVPQPEEFKELSMGMSGDFELAIEEGATTVRVGQALFGTRSLPNEAYWPG